MFLGEIKPMGLTIYQSITPAGITPQPPTDKTSLCGSDRAYTIKKWFGVRRSTWLLSMYLVAYFLFLVGGCLLFSTLEQGAEEELKNGIDQRKKDFVQAHPGVKDADLEKLIDDIMYRGISPKRRDLKNSNWSFGQSLLFTVTVVTTIGYGHINPVTPDGKLACIAYAVIGIPFTLIFLSALVQRLLAPTFKLLSSFLKLLPKMDNFQVRLMHLATMSSLFLLLIMLLPSIIFYLLEPGWTLLDTFYFVFISLTTIGLGDYIPGDNEMHEPYRDAYKSCVGLFLLMGLVFMSLTLTVFYDIPQLNLGLHLLRHRDISDKDSTTTIKRKHTDSETSTQTMLKPSIDYTSAGHDRILESD